MITDQQVMDALAATNYSTKRSAELLGITERSMRRRKAKVTLSGVAPSMGLHTPVEEPYQMGKVTVQRNKLGEVERTWARYNPEAEQILQAIEAAVEELKSQYSPELPTPAPSNTNPDLVNAFLITDYHLGMKSWGEETGADWDTKIAADLLVKWFAMAIEQAPQADHCVFAQLGDFLHWDGLASVTPTSGHIVDADTRYQHIIRVAIQVIRRCVAMLLKRHKTVYLLMAEGNHDLAGSAWLRELFAELYRDEPRITVDTSADPYYCYEFGETALYFHHGHKKRMDSLDTVFVAKFRQVYGRCRHNYGFTGHLHHDKVFETNLMVMEQLRTLSAPDSHASRGGWISGRDARVDTFHKRYGRVGRVFVSPEMVEDVPA